MKQSTQLLGAVSAFALIAMSSAPAMAEGIEAGTIVTNTVNVDYQVGGVDQTRVTATDTFSIDRRVNVDVNFVGATGASGTPREVAPGQTGVALLYDVTNFSNSAIDLDLTATLVGTDIGRGTITAVFVDTNNNGQLDSGEEEFLANMAADETRQVTVLVDIESGAVDAESFEVDLNANAHVAGSMTAPGTGTELEETAGGATSAAGVDTALVDGNSGFSNDAARDGSDTDRSFVEISAASVSVVKSSLVVSDPVNGNTNPKAIPGAVIRYCIAVTNSGSGATATGISISDALPGEVDFNSGTIRRNVTAQINSGVASCTPTSGDSVTDTDGDADGGSYDSGSNTVSGTVSDVVAGTSQGFMFEVTIPAAVDDASDGSTTSSVTAVRDTPD